MTDTRLDLLRVESLHIVCNSCRPTAVSTGTANNQGCGVGVGVTRNRMFWVKSDSQRH